jgi:hypothetical protein
MKLAQMKCLNAALVVCAASISSLPLLAQASDNVSVFATGLEGPRGLKFGPDGYLYVAEAGLGGTNSTTASQCTQVPGPIGPYTNGDTGRISKIDHSGKVTTVATGFPSAMSADATQDTLGVGDIAFLDGELYAVTAGGGCSHGNLAIPNSLVRVNGKTGKWTAVANLSAALVKNPATYPDAADFEPDGVFYSLIAANDRLYTVEPNHGQVFSITPSGEVNEAIDISEAEAHIVPTSITERDGEFFVGNLGLFPVVPNYSKILTLSGNESRTSFWGMKFRDIDASLHVAGSRAGFATIVALDFGPDGLLYALELTPVAGYPTPFVGKVVRLNRENEIEDVATGLMLPGGMTFGPDGALYVSNFGAVSGTNGQIVRVSVPPAD